MSEYTKTQEYLDLAVQSSDLWFKDRALQRAATELTTAQSEIEALRGRVAMQADGIDAAIDYIGSFCAGFPKATEMLDALSKVQVAGAEEYRLRVQAEALEAAVYELTPVHFGPPDDPSQEFIAACEMCAEFSGYAQHLRQQAAEAERAGGEQ